MRSLDSGQGLTAVKKGATPCIPTKPSSASSTPPSPAATPRRWRAATTTTSSSRTPPSRSCTGRKPATCGGCCSPGPRTWRSSWRRPARTPRAGTRAGPPATRSRRRAGRWRTASRRLFAFRDGKIVRHYDRFSVLALVVPGAGAPRALPRLVRAPQVDGAPAGGSPTRAIPPEKGVRSLFRWRKRDLTPFLVRLRSAAGDFPEIR